MQITINTLDNWYEEKYMHRSKRRKLNKTMDDIEDQSEDEEEEEIPLNRSMHEFKINK